eukprot:Nitzschia sp. Nitz4//scaffold1_size375055//22941//26060//NITZ4_000211-RA/size375055-processed-gene-0.7-mRNA-1//1//CDS//3329540850//9420//frame0
MEADPETSGSAAGSSNNNGEPTSTVESSNPSDGTAGPQAKKNKGRRRPNRNNRKAQNKPNPTSEQHEGASDKVTDAVANAAPPNESVDENKANDPSVGKNKPGRRRPNKNNRNKKKQSEENKEVIESEPTGVDNTVDVVEENTHEPPNQPTNKRNNRNQKKKKKGGKDNNNGGNEAVASDNQAPHETPEPSKNGKQKDRGGRGGKPKNNNQGQQQQKGSSNQKHNNNKKSSDKIMYPKHDSLAQCMKRYNDKDPNIIRGKLRVLPTQDGAAFCTCDRGTQSKDVLIETPLERNRALNGDEVFVELLPLEEGQDIPEASTPSAKQGGDEMEEEESWWQDDEVQVGLWDPVVRIRRNNRIVDAAGDPGEENLQRKGKVIHVVPPKFIQSEVKSSSPKQNAPVKRLVGHLKRLQRGATLFIPTNKCLPHFRLTNSAADRLKDTKQDAIYTAIYTYGTWEPSHSWPPCGQVEQLGLSCNVEDETKALLIENDVDHGEFPQEVLDECQNVVASGEYSEGSESGWKPTPEMYAGREDFRQKRIFTIDPTTAKDLDDALHIEELPNGEIEIGVHIADVSHFVETESHLDEEANRRCTTVYLVDRTIPMLPRPLCEIACSLNENVERLAFSCVWRMRRNGTMVKGHKVFYGRSVIRSCARLDYSTAQNIIDRKVAHGETELDEDLWPESRRPTGGHTIGQVAADVRLMHEVGMARRQKRFANGALALNAVKLTFQLDADRETPLGCQQYPIKDSNRLVEEYMLLANYLVAQRLVTHAGERALLRNHESPLLTGLEKVVAIARESIGAEIDITSAGSLQNSLNRLGRECTDEVALKCITEMLKMPMKPATYIAAGSMSESDCWSHFALNIPYYTHFTSPIRRYADVIVHRLLQATLDGEGAVKEFPLNENEIGSICERCNDKKEASRKAQDRSDVVFLALYLRRQPMTSQMGVVLSVGQKAFTVFVPSLGISNLLYLDEHTDWLSYEAIPGVEEAERKIKLLRTKAHKNETWQELIIRNFVKVRVTCSCQDKPPISVKLQLEGPWTEG